MQTDSILMRERVKFITEILDFHIPIVITSPGKTLAHCKNIDTTQQMKTTSLSLLFGSAVLLLPNIGSAALLIGFHSFTDETAPNSTSFADTAPESQYSGFSGAITSTYELTKDATGGDTGGAGDPFYGDSNYSAGVGNDGDIRLGSPNGGQSLTFSVSNNLLVDYSLQSLLFDATISTPGGAFSIFYTITGGLLPPVASTAVPGSPQTVTVPTNPSGAQPESVVYNQDYEDFLLDLSGITLGAGQTIAFTFSRSGGTLTNGGRLDNIALTGSEFSAIPEPGSLVALGGLVGAGAFLRTRRRPASFPTA